MTEWVRTGSKVKGVYCGVVFSGIVTGSRAHSINHRQMADISLDADIVIFGDKRSDINDCDIERLDRFAVIN